MIQDRFFHTLDTIITALGATLPAMSTMLLATVHPYDPKDALFQTLLPLIGAIITALGAFWLNPQAETRPIVAGRALFGILAGTAAPSVIGITPNLIPESWGWIVIAMSWPGSLVIMGGVLSFVAYVLSRPFCFNAYERAGAIARAQVKRLEQLAQGPHNTVIVLDPNKLKEPPAEGPASS